MFSWEKATDGLLDAVGLKSIKVKIMLFALLATLIPSLTMGWLSYRNNRRAIDEKVVQELTSLTAQAAREVSLWLRERRYELKVLSSSYEVLENLAKLNEPDGEGSDKDIALTRLQDYLGSIGKKFADYRDLFAVDTQGHVLASSAGPSGGHALGPDRLDPARPGWSIAASASRDQAPGPGSVDIVEPIRSASGVYLGALGAKISLGDLEGILASYIRDPSQELYLMTRSGEILISSRGLRAPFMPARLDTVTTDSLFGDETAPLKFSDFRGTKVVGALRRVPELEWGVVADKDRVTAYAAIVRLRNLTLGLISTLVLAIGMAAYLLGLSIVRPLGRLTQGAAKVAGGNLDVDLPILGGSEVSYLTEVFNEMVARLRRFRDENVAINQELRERAITDSLTRLHNRTQLPDLLAKELARSQRHQHSFSILMIDIDHFKRFNDTHGHQAGDDLLKRVAGILRNSVRSCDLAARYGGEEFLILLTETSAEGALALAEKLRARVEEMPTRGGTVVTISIGVASFPEHGDDVESLIRRADDALYECKRQGRNRVAAAQGSRRQESPFRVSTG